MTESEKAAIRKMVTDSLGRNVLLGITEEYWKKEMKTKPAYKLSYMKTIYMEARDPTEYKPAMLLFADWAHWLAFRNHHIYKPIIDEWKAELEVMLKSEMVANTIELAKSPGGFAAAKWLHDKGFDADPAKRGRPAKDKPDLTSNPHVEEKLAGVIHLVRK